MAKVDQGLIGDLQSRGLVAQMTGEGAFAEHLSERRVLYCGFDPTADSLHIGSLVPLLALRRFQLAGHKPVALVGGATGLIGDPSFKAQERQLNTPEIVAAWSERLRQQVSRFIDFDGGSCSAEVANNLDWMGGMPVLDFLRDVGKHFAVNAMIHKESVKTRIEREGEGISYTEFSYMLLQSYDFAELNKRFDCTLQIGGSDQWGNITGGIDLVRRIHRVQAFGLTLPLITKSDGSKFGKTESGTIWLDPAKTSPYAFFQFWVNVADQDVYRFLRYFTFLPVSELLEIERADEQVQGKRSAQGILAREVTRLVHGEEGVEAAERISAALFSGALDKLTENDMEQLALDGMPCSDIKVEGLSLIDALVATGLALTPRGEVTQGQARKFIRDGAVRVNGVPQKEESFSLNRAGAYFGRFHLLRRGKKHFHLIRWQ
ncbi:MAG: tyrosine--tRNA ligase [Gammaproteobacteria bacterium]|nr:tyrosine--tRNA ligase [Gammaproteobacteria bacterium]MBQ0840957.1 tyrosine--tRNA ligase [Gammaproteobacteria bacterium]